MRDIDDRAGPIKPPGPIEARLSTWARTVKKWEKKIVLGQIRGKKGLDLAKTRKNDVLKEKRMVGWVRIEQINGTNVLILKKEKYKRAG